MTSQPDSSCDSNAFWKEQDYEQSARLHLQHWVWQYHLGYALHPKIDVSDNTALKIADVAAGDGAWMLQVASDLGGRTWNCLASVSQAQTSQTQLGFQKITLLGNNVDPLLSNCLKMLKPGGHLQWDESDGSTLECFAPDDTTKTDACKQILAMQDFSARMFTKMTQDWLQNLSPTLRRRGYEVVAHDDPEPDRRLARAWTDSMLLVWRSMVALIPEQKMPLPPGMGLPEILSSARFAALLEDAFAETQQGVMLRMQYHVYVAKKA